MKESSNTAAVVDIIEVDKAIKKQSNPLQNIFAVS